MIFRNHSKIGTELSRRVKNVQLFFRELPQPLIKPKTSQQYLRWCQTPSFDDEDALVAELKSLISELDDAYRETLKVLFDHFLKVIEFSSQNRMAAHNLAVVFGPTLIGCPDGNVSFENVLTHNNIVQTMLQVYPNHNLFPK